MDHIVSIDHDIQVAGAVEAYSRGVVESRDDGRPAPLRGYLVDISRTGAAAVKGITAHRVDGYAPRRLPAPGPGGGRSIGADLSNVPVAGINRPDITRGIQGHIIREAEFRRSALPVRIARSGRVACQRGHIAAAIDPADTMIAGVGHVHIKIGVHGDAHAPVPVLSAEVEFSVRTL